MSIVFKDQFEGKGGAFVRDPHTGVRSIDRTVDLHHPHVTREQPAAPQAPAPAAPSDDQE